MQKTNPEDLINIKVDNYIKNVKKYISSAYNGKVPEEYTSSLEMLETNYRIFLQSKSQIEKEGITIKEFRGATKPHPCLLIQKDAMNMMLKILTQFGMTSYSKSKLKHIKEEETDVNLLDSLLNS